MFPSGLQGWKLSIGDVKTSFLAGDQTEAERLIFADPPTEARDMLGMQPWELFRVMKAITGWFMPPESGGKS